MATWLCIFAAFLILGQGSCSPVTKKTTLSLDDVIFQLYTRNNLKEGKRVFIGNLSSFDGTGFDSTLPTKFIVHGFMDDYASSVIQKPKNAFLALEPMNVFGIDWSPCSKVVLYEQTVDCAKQVGTFVGEMIKWLIEEANVPLENFHVLGHSLGAQAISFVSRVIKIKHITSLDPAGPLFSHVGPENRIDSSDADFVDILHTSTKVIGMTPPTGHVDFYPNGGINQPGCHDIFGGCAHSVAYDLYVWTIPEAQRNEYVTYKCESLEEAQNQTCTGTPTVVMGYGTDHSARGIYFIDIPNLPSMV